MGFVGEKNWHKKEFKESEVWDKRCKNSLSSIAKALYDNQTKSFSSACGQTLRQNGSRIFSSKKMTKEKLQAGHYKETMKRASKESIVLCVQDTTELNYTGHKATTGLGPIGSSDKAQGMFLHSCMVLRPDGLPLGILGQKYWSRDPATKGKKHRRKELSIEKKESYKWLEGLQWVNNRLSRKIKEIWLVADRESDVYEYLASPREKNVYLLTRVAQSRTIEEEIAGTQKVGQLKKLIKELPEIGTKEVEIERKKRTIIVTLSISYSRIKIYPPKYKSKEYEPIEMTIIHAEEKGNTDAKEKIEWILLSSKPDLDRDGAILMVDYYAQRWKVERFHYTLKSGAFNIEKLQFDDAETLINAISMYSIVAWRLMYVTYYGRLEPLAKSEVVIDTTEKEILEAYTKKPILTALQAVMAIGALGGFLGGSKRYPYPGIKSMWIGLVKLYSMKIGWLLAKKQFLKI